MRSSNTHEEEEQENDNKFSCHGSSFSALDVCAQSGFGVDLLLKAGCSSVLAVDCVDSGVKNTQATTHEHIRERRSTTTANISSYGTYSENVDKSIVQTELCELLPMPCKTIVSCLPPSHSHEHYHRVRNKLLVDNNTSISHQNKNVPILWKKAMESEKHNSAGHIVQFKRNNFLQQEQYKHKQLEKNELSEMTFTSAAKARRELARQQGRCINGVPDTLSISSHRNYEYDSSTNNSHNSNNNVDDDDDDDRYRSIALHEKMNATINSRADLSSTCIEETEAPESELWMTQSLCKFNKKAQSAVDVLYFHPPPSYLLPFNTIQELLPMT